MLTEFIIENFKKFNKLELKNLARVNLFLGNNNSGKSTVLEAIELSANSDFFNALKKSLRVEKDTSDKLSVSAFMELSDNIETYLFDDRKLKEKRNNIAKFIVSTNTIKESLIVSIEIRDNVEEKQIRQLNVTTGYRQSLIFKVIKYEIKSNSNLLADSSVIIYDDRTLSGSKMNEQMIFEVKRFQDYNIQEIGKLYSNIVINKKKNMLLEKLKIFDANIVNIELINHEFKVDVGRSIMIPINHLGTGIISIVYLMIYMLNSENGVLLIDEIENGIYYKKIDKLIQVIDEHLLN